MKKDVVRRIISFFNISLPLYIMQTIFK